MKVSTRRPDAHSTVSRTIRQVLVVESGVSEPLPRVYRDIIVAHQQSGGRLARVNTKGNERSGRRVEISPTSTGLETTSDT